MPAVTETLTPLNGSTRVRVFLAGENGAPLGEAYDLAGNKTYIGPYTTDPDDSGVWTQTLIANSLLMPAGTRWKRIIEGGARTPTASYALVPDGIGPYRWEDILSSAPGDILDPDDAATLAAQIAVLQAEVDAIQASEGAVVITTATFDAIQSALTGAGIARLDPEVTYLSTATRETLLVPTGAVLDGAGAILKARNSSPANVLIQNSDTVNGNENITIRNIRLDGNRANQSGTDPLGSQTPDDVARKAGLLIHRCPGVVIDNVWAYDVDGDGMRLNGNHGGEETPGQILAGARVAHLTNLRATGNRWDGIWAKSGFRNVISHGWIARENDNDGIRFDHSEDMASSCIADSNGHYGFFITNLYGSSQSKLVATRNAHCGIFVESLCDSIGGEWFASCNGHGNGTPVAGSADIFFSVNARSYGVSEVVTVVGGFAGFTGRLADNIENVGVLTDGKWEGSIPDFAPHPIWFDDGVNHANRLLDFVEGASTDGCRFPADMGSNFVQLVRANEAVEEVYGQNWFKTGGLRFSNGTSIRLGATTYDVATLDTALTDLLTVSFPERRRVATGLQPVVTSDSFGGGDLADLNGRATDIALGGTAKTWAENDTSNAFSIVSGRVTKAAVSSAQRVATVDAGTGDVLVSAILAAAPVTSPASITARHPDTTTDTCYRAQVSVGGVTMVLSKIVGGAATTLVGSLTIAVGDAIGILCKGSRICAVRNGLIVAEVVDTSIPNSNTRCGFRAFANSVSFQFDDFMIESL